MAMRSTRNPPFNREGDFVWCHPNIVNGKAVKSGEQVDKDLFNTRRLKTLYTSRHIRLKPLGAMRKVIEIKHVGRGKYRLFKDGESISQPLTRMEAEILRDQT